MTVSKNIQPGQRSLDFEVLGFSLLSLYLKPAQGEMWLFFLFTLVKLFTIIVLPFFNILVKLYCSGYNGHLLKTNAHETFLE
jgi:hypothetical protein